MVDIAAVVTQNAQDCVMSGVGIATGARADCCLPCLLLLLLLLHRLVLRL